MEPPLYFVRDRGSRVAHHWDYEGDRNYRALCGHVYTSEIAFEGYTRPSRVCLTCQELAPKFEAKLWRQIAEKADAKRTQLQQRIDIAQRDLQRRQRHIAHLNRQLGAARQRNATLQRKVENQQATLRQLQAALKNAKRGAQPRRGRESGTKVKHGSHLAGVARSRKYI
jgi:predicted  nucleic acid-binding Zn-ribbon protein